MIELQKDDIPVLNFIINELCKSGVYSITLEYLQKQKKFGFGSNSFESFDDSIRKEENEFKRIVSILDKYDCVETNLKMPFSGELRISSGNNLFQFIKQEGFKNEFKKQNKKTWYNENWIGYLIALITLIFAIYQWNQNYNLEKVASFLKIEVLSLKKKHDSLNAQHVLFEKKLYDLKIEIEVKK